MTPQNGFTDTRATTSGALTATGAETVLDTTVIISFCIGGKAYAKAATADIACPTTDAMTGLAITLVANFAMMLVWCLDSGGNLKVIKGETVPWDGVAFIQAPEFPTIDYDTYCPIAYQIIKGGSTVSGTWTLGTSNWNATGITTGTPVNVHTLPTRPKIA